MFWGVFFFCYEIGLKKKKKRKTNLVLSTFVIFDVRSNLATRGW